MTTVTLIYALLYYIAALVLVCGLAWKLIRYARTPQPLKIPITPAPITRTGVVWRLFKETVFFESLFKANKWTWLFGWLFHLALLLALFHHLNAFFGSFGWLLAASRHAGALLTIGLAGLWARRLLVDRVRHLSAPSDHLMLALLLSITLTGLGMRYLAYPDVFATRQFFLSLLSFAWSPLPEQPLLLLHLALVAILMIVFPMSKLLHAPGLFFSPTRNQADNARERRHSAGWTATKR